MALDQLLDKLELQYADAEEDETSDDLVIEYDMQELNDELMDKLGISEDDAQYAPEDEDEDDSEAVDENGETNDETQLDAEAAKEGAESDDEPAGDGENAGDSEDDQTEDESNPQPIPTTSEVRQNNAESTTRPLSEATSWRCLILTAWSTAARIRWNMLQRASARPKASA